MNGCSKSVARKGNFFILKSLCCILLWGDCLFEFPMIDFAILSWDNPSRIRLDDWTGIVFGL